MKIQIPKVIIPVDMAEYAPELAGKFLQVWVNPPKNKLQEYDDLVTELQESELKRTGQQLFPPEEKKDAAQTGLRKALQQMQHWITIKREQKPGGIDEGLLRWYAEIWSQGPEDSRWSAEELRTLEAEDPAFLSWMMEKTWSTRTEHVQRKKKA